MNFNIVDYAQLAALPAEIIGFSLVIVELYFPRTAKSFEDWIDNSQVILSKEVKPYFESASILKKFLFFLLQLVILLGLRRLQYIKIRRPLQIKYFHSPNVSG